MKKRIVSAVMSAVLVAGLLAGCGSKQESWKVTCPWAPSGVAAMVSQKAATLSPNHFNSIETEAKSALGDELYS